MVKFPRMYITTKTYAVIAKAAKKAKLTHKEMGEKIALAGIKALRLK